MWKLPDGRDRLWENLGLALMGGAMLSKFLIQFSVDGWGCVPSLLFDLRPNYGGGKQESSRKTSISALLTKPKPLTVWITINCGKF